MVDTAVRSLARTLELQSAVQPAAVAGTRSPALSVLPALQSLLPDGLRRGSTVSVSGSTSLLLALLAAASAEGAWCVLVDLPFGGGAAQLSAEAAEDYGIDLARLPLVPCAGKSWTTVVGALLDAFDVVAARPPTRLPDGDLRRLAARARARQSVLVPVLASGGRWPTADLRLAAEPGEWVGIGDGYGRLSRRQVRVVVDGRGQSAGGRSATLWLPDARGGVTPEETESVAPVVKLSEARFSG
ncbi:MAG TPA: hypothetical protein VHV76_07140 [Mycobacteriales bacterium]|jgi:hypothetical protein|nr:hypothetical protein [Mycobacteriales bacterium]